jgi:hypothetical protein
MFDFLEKIELKYRKYKQIPVRDFLYAGMEKYATLFSVVM